MSAVAGAVGRAGLYRHGRNAYQHVFNREHMRERRRLRAWYRGFMSPGDLVFDVGAHRGHYAETFREIGARVVAIEANAELAGEIRRRFPGIAVEAVAVGSEAGEAMLRRGRDSEHSTVSASWARTKADRWVDEVAVPMVTLDALIARHGVPAFCKIDVEGHEDETLVGLTQPLAALSLEFQCADPAIAVRAVRRLLVLGSYEFDVVTAGGRALGDSIADADAVGAILLAFAAEDAEADGDVYARSAGDAPADRV
jgi:FkbM family methyltransferase